MKRTIWALCALCLLLALPACGGGSAKAPFDPVGAAQALLDSGAFSEPLAPIGGDMACALYGIDRDTVRACAVYGSTGATAEELAAFAFGDEEGAKAALAALQGRVQDRKEEMADYLPAEVPKLDGAVAERRGASVLLVVAADYGPVRDFLEG